MKNYGMPFKNAAIDKLGGKFGDPDKPKVEGPVNLMGVQNALNKGVAGVKKAAQTVANTKISNPVKVTKSSTALYDNSGKYYQGQENTTTRNKLVGKGAIVKKEVTNMPELTKTYSRSTTDFKGRKVYEAEKVVDRKSGTEGVTTKSTAYNPRTGAVKRSDSTFKSTADQSAKQAMKDAKKVIRKYS